MAWLVIVTWYPYTRALLVITLALYSIPTESNKKGADSISDLVDIEKDPSTRISFSSTYAADTTAVDHQRYSATRLVWFETCLRLNRPKLRISIYCVVSELIALWQLGGMSYETSFDCCFRLKGHSDVEMGITDFSSTIVYIANQPTLYTARRITQDAPDP